MPRQGVQGSAAVPSPPAPRPSAAQPRRRREHTSKGLAATPAPSASPWPRGARPRRAPAGAPWRRGGEVRPLGHPQLGGPRRALRDQATPVRVTLAPAHRHIHT